MKNLPDKQYLVNKVGKKKDLPKLKKTSAEVISLYADDGVDFGGGGTSDFNKLDNRPKYKGQPMTGDTDIMGGGAIVRHGAPTKGTEAELGQTYLDDESGNYYILNSIENGQYLWSKIKTETFLSNIKYGELSYYSVWESSCELEWAENVTLERVDIARFDQWLADNPGVMSEWEQSVNFDYNNESEDHFWQVWAPAGQIIIPENEIYATTGLDLQVAEGAEWAYCSVVKSVEVDKNSEILTINILGKQLETLGNSDALADFIGLGDNNDITVNKQAVLEFWYNNDTLMSYPNYFLSKCSNLEKIGDSNHHNDYGQIWQPNATIGDYFLSECPNLKPLSYNGMFIIQAKEIGDYCLERCFNKTVPEGLVSINIVAPKIGNDLLYNNSAFTGQVVLTCKESLGSGAISYCSGITQVTIGNADAFVTKIDHGFLHGCSALTKIISGGNTEFDFGNITEIGGQFMQGCESYNRPLKFLALKKVGADFLADCTSYNSTISFPMLEEIGDRFMMGCSNFARTLKFPSLRRIRGERFMQQCTNFNNGNTRLDFPNLLAFNSKMMLYAAKNLSNGIYFGQADVEIQDDSFSNKYCFSCDSASSPSYTNGIPISGPGRTTVMSTFPNRSSSPYRKLLDGGE